MLDWRRYQVWDLLRREPVGPPLPRGTDGLSAVSVGLLHGRAVLAAGVGASLRLWDLAGGEPIGTWQLDSVVVGTAVGPSTLFALTAAGVGPIAVQLQASQTHPVARRTGQAD